jgi:hypothetical protein
MFLGEDLLQWLLLALGGALFVGNVTAMVRPPADQQEEGQLERAPIGRSLFYAALGLVAAIWALATLITGRPAHPGSRAPGLPVSRSSVAGDSLLAGCARQGRFRQPTGDPAGRERPPTVRATRTTGNDTGASGTGRERPGRGGVTRTTGTAATTGTAGTTGTDRDGRGTDRN